MSGEYPERTLDSRAANGKMDVSPFDDLADEYDAWFDEEGKLVFDIEIRAFQEILPVLPRPWIEIGVGSGRFARALGIDTGIEPSINLVKMARQRGINTFWGRGEQKIFKEASIGTVFLITTLCFLNSPLEVLKEAYRILKPEGKLVLGVVLKDNPWGQQYQQKKMEGHRFYKYATFYECNEVSRLTIQAGFMGERIISTLFQKPGEVKQLEEPLNGLYLDAGFVIVVAEKTNDEPGSVTGSK
jgi:SAM-dependent methyltransferase